MKRLLFYRSIVLFLVTTAAVVLAPIVCAQPAGNASNKSTGAITGRVIDSAGEPLAGASVWASAGRTSTSATADARGNFKIDGLSPGLYFINAAMPGYVNPQFQAFNDSPTFYHLGDSATLTLLKGAVITGTVSGPNGPLIGVGVFAMRVRDPEGKQLVASLGYPERRTDDRGVFRFYGLIPGAYILCATKPRIGAIVPSAYDNDVPIYYPSSMRDTAAEIIVRDGDEMTADIRYRAETGHAVSGQIVKVIEAANPSFANEPTISIIDVHDRTEIYNTGISPSDTGFAFYGLADGEYELTARQFLRTRDEEFRSPPLRVTVRGADVTGLNLSLAPLASIDGRLVIESDPKFPCGKRPDSAARETMIWVRRYAPQGKRGDDKVGDPVSVSATNHTTSAISDAKGLFSVKNLPGGSYRIDPLAPASGWYVRSISKGPVDSPAARAASFAIARDGIAVRNGERFTGVVVTITEGAAQLRGRVTAGERETLPPRSAVYLVPAEQNAFENVLRFYEAQSDAGGAFTVNNVAPGNYWILARPLADSEPLAPAKSIRRDAALRAKVLQEAESLKKALTLKPCEDLANFDLKYTIVSEARP